MVIDIFCHHVTRRVVDLVSKYGYYGEDRVEYELPLPLNNEDLDRRLTLMDKYGIDISAICQTTPVIMGATREEAVEVCRMSNDDNFALCKAHPDRFVNVCMLTIQDPAASLDELKRCINELDCRGVTLASQENNKGLDSPDLYPIYEVLEERKLPILIHPMHWDNYPLVDMQQGWRMMHIFGWPFDSVQAVWRLIFGGVLDRFPGLNIVMHHLGAMLPFLARRVEGNVNAFLTSRLKRPWADYMKQIYADTATDGTPGSYACGYAFFGPDRMCFGSDFPFGAEAGEDFLRENLAGVKAMAVPAGEKANILGGNAARLLKIS